MKQFAKRDLKHLERSYEREQVNDFLDAVSNRYLPEQVSELKAQLIDRFSTSSAIRVKIFIDSYVINREKKRIAVKAHWNRILVESGQTAPTRAQGQTTFFFEIKNGRAKLIDMRGDALFD